MRATGLEKTTKELVPKYPGTYCLPGRFAAVASSTAFLKGYSAESPRASADALLNRARKIAAGIDLQVCQIGADQSQTSQIQITNVKGKGRTGVGEDRGNDVAIGQAKRIFDDPDGSGQLCINCSSCGDHSFDGGGQGGGASGVPDLRTGDQEAGEGNTGDLNIA